MRFGSVCSGIESASVAWQPLGWSPAFFAEVEKFPSAVLAHHYGSNMPGEPHARNGVPNFGDMTKFRDWPDADIDVLGGGTPCQSFSVAGLRAGMADPRGNLALVYLALADRYRPEWLLWENVPGVLSSSEGRDFGAFIGGLAELGYGFAWRVLDAQYVRVDGYARAVPQRRRRVFVVGNSRSWRRAAAVLFERESLLWDSPPRREAGKGIAPTISARTKAGGGLGTDFDCDGGLIVGGGPDGGRISGNVSSKWSKGTGGPAGDEAYNLIAIQERAVCENPAAGPDGVGIRDDGAAYTLEARTVPQAIAFDTTQITSKGNYSAPKDGDPCHPLASGAHPPCIAFSAKDHGGDSESEVSPTLRAGGFTGSHANAGVMPAVAFQPRFARNDRGAPSDIAHALTSEAGRTGKGDSAQCVQQGWAVRRLTPRECERLQGFPDDHTLIEVRGKPAADGPRYKALGNSMAVNVMRWIGRRIDHVNRLAQESETT